MLLKELWATFNGYMFYDRLRRKRISLKEEKKLSALCMPEDEFEELKIITTVTEPNILGRTKNIKVEIVCAHEIA